MLGADGAAGSSESIQVLADTGATLTLLPREVLSRLGIKPAGTAQGSFANGQKGVREIGEARLRVEGHELTTRVMFGEASDARLLGLVVLESLGLAVDPARRRLVPSDFLLL